MNNEQRIALEQRIARHAIREAAKEGFYPVYMEGVGKVKNEKTAIDALFAVDSGGTMTFEHRDTKKRAGVLFVTGNGYDILTDYNVVPGFNEAMERTEEYVNNLQSGGTLHKNPRKRRMNVRANPAKRGPSQVKRLQDSNAPGPWKFEAKFPESGKTYFMNRYAKFNEAWLVATRFAETYPGVTVILKDESKREKTVRYKMRSKCLTANPAPQFGKKSKFKQTLKRVKKTVKAIRRSVERLPKTAPLEKFVRVQYLRGGDWFTLAMFPNTEAGKINAQQYAREAKRKAPSVSIRVIV